MAAAAIRSLELHKDEGRHLEGKLFTLRVGQTMRFCLGPTLMSHEIHVMCDYPQTGQPFQRAKYHELDWIFNRGDKYDPDRHADIPIKRAGTFHFYYLAADDHDDSFTGAGYIVVEPNLGYSLDGICCITHISKLLGLLTEWEGRLRVSHEAAYNMIHFTPIQQLGSSQSAYSISDQLALCDRYLPAGYKPKDVKVTYTDAVGASHDLLLDQAFVDVKKLVDKMNKEWNMTCITDVVWNHTSFDSPWLPNHPDAAYNLVNSPHLRPAYALDATLKRFSDEIAAGEWMDRGINATVTSERDISIIASRLMDTVLPNAKLWEYFCVDVDAIVSEFRQNLYKAKSAGKPAGIPSNKSLDIIQDPEYHRYGSSIDGDVAMEIFNVSFDQVICYEERIEHCCRGLLQHLENLNLSKQQMVTGQLQKSTDNLAANLRYQFLDPKGPQRRDITKKRPLFPRYFYVLNDGDDLTNEDIEEEAGRYVVAHNGWVMDADPLVNFAGPGSLVYFQRELIEWGDSVKLRYGESHDDSPFLWDLITKYTQINAWLFHGFRLDNCHNTPIHVAETLLNIARQVRPNLYVVAELFTSSEEKENYFVNRLGINSLIKEAMFASTSRNLGHLVHHYGGTAVGSFIEPEQSPLRGSVTRAMFVDATHDNDPGHIQSRSVWDALPNTALVSIAGCAVGSCRGYDELVPHMIGVVKETRPYTTWSADKTGNGVHSNSGIVAAKAELNRLHQKLAKEGYTQIFANVVTDDVIAVTRHCPTSHKSVFLVAHTSFWSPHNEAIPTDSNSSSNHCFVPSMSVPGVIDEVILEAKLVRDNTLPGEFVKPADVIGGLKGYHLDMQSHIPLDQSKICQLIASGDTQEVQFDGYSVGSVLVLSVSMVPEAVAAIQHLRGFTNKPLTATGSKASHDQGKSLYKELVSTIGSLSLVDLNYVLYRCDNEEQVDSPGNGVYNIPGYGPLTYCGLQGILSVLETVRSSNDLGHPLCHNLRGGDWLINYTINRLRLLPATTKLANVIDQILEHVKTLPRYLIPCYFDAVISVIYHELVSSTIGNMSKFVRNGSSIVHSLALGHAQLFSRCADAPLPQHGDTATSGDSPTPSLAAGLPHFSTGAMRCWGRDTFISLRGLMLVTGQHQHARNCLLAFGACVRHGLVPNLLAGGVSARYNCRDAVWWWLQCLKEYVTMVTNGEEILKARVTRIYPEDDTFPNEDVNEQQTVAELVQEVLQRHFNGISFRERGAGPALDNHMSDEGFNVTAGISEETGFVYGGSSTNCGTWMDKMGESSMAGNLGVPATPRDGSAVELVGLCYSVVEWLASLYSNGTYPHDGVFISNDEEDDANVFTYAGWADTIKQSFEEHFYIPVDRTEANDREKDLSHFIHKTGIYKDSLGASMGYPDYRLRPNFTIAMTVAPNLFDAHHAWEVLKIAETKLLGPVGIATLDPDDWIYNGYYENWKDSYDYHTAKGFNYHQGPEWLWLVGYFLRAKIIFAQRLGGNDYMKEAIAVCNKMLASHAAILRESPWKGLPELTNKNGSPCQDSCPVQAWSMATMLDVLYDLEQYKTAT